MYVFLPLFYLICRKCNYNIWELYNAQNGIHVCTISYEKTKTVDYNNYMDEWIITYGFDYK